MIRLRDVLGVQGIEDTERLNRAARVSNDHDLSARIAKVSREAFGLVESETGFEYPAWVAEREDGDLSEAELERLGDEWVAWEAQFDLSDRPNRIAAWAASGWDVTDPDGNVLLCLPHFWRQMVCVSKGLRGRSLQDVATDAWAARLKPTASPTISPEQKVRNQAFLGLGARRSRRAS